jgi:hypothetical protein
MRVLKRSADNINYDPGYRAAPMERNTALLVGSLQYFHLDKSI